MEPDINAVFGQLMDRADTLGALLVPQSEVADWPPGVLASLMELGILGPAEKADSLECTQCAEGCWITPLALRRPDGSAFLGNVCELREEIGLVTFEPEQLQTWRVSMAGIASVVSSALKLPDRPTEIEPGYLWELGYLTVGGRRSLVVWAWGFNLPDGQRVVNAAARHLEATQPIILVPRQRPEPGVWPDAPSHIRAISDLVCFQDGHFRLQLDDLLPRNHRPAKRRSIRPVTLPPGITAWNQVTIRIVDEEHIEIQAGSHTERRHYAECGMSDARYKDPVPNADWVLLLDLAQQGGELCWQDRIASPAARAAMKRLRSRLRELLHIDEDPIGEYRKHKKWHTKFILTDLRKSGPPRNVTSHEPSR